MLQALALTRFLHSRWCLMVMMILAVGLSYASFAAVGPLVEPMDHGILFPSANLWISSPTVSAVVSVAAVLVIGVLMVALNRTFNLLRSPTLLDASIFMAMAIGLPRLLTSFGSGVLLCLAVLLCLFLLYGSYAQPLTCQRHIYLIFTVLTALAMTQYCFVLYVPVFIIGCMQMRIFNWRTLLAALFGIITPWWLAFGTGLVPVTRAHVPDIAGMFGSFNLEQNVPMIVAMFFTAVLLVGSWMLNFPKMIAYNAHMRAYNGMLSVLSLATLLLCVIDFVNIVVYAPLLGMCTAFQTGRLFVGRAGQSYIAILSIIAIYIILYACQTISLSL